MQRLQRALVAVVAIVGCNGGANPARDTLREVTLNDVPELPKEWHWTAIKRKGPLSPEVREPGRSAIEEANTIELHSLHPHKPVNGGNNSMFPQTEIIGCVRIADADTRKLLLAALDQGVRQFYDNDEETADCFFPRHGILINHRGTEYYFVICFECSIVAVYVDGKFDRELLFGISESAQPVFDALLTAGEVPLAPK